MTDAESLRDDLEALVGSPGWRWLLAKAKTEAETRKDQGIRLAANELADAVALNKLRQVLMWEGGVDFVLKMPLEQLQQLRLEAQQTKTGFDPSRRGPL